MVFNVIFMRSILYSKSQRVLVVGFTYGVFAIATCLLLSAFYTSGNHVA